MDGAQIRAIAERLFDVHQRREMDRATGPVTVDTAEYTDPARLAREQERIFDREPQLVGFAGDLRAPGDYVTTTLGRLPVLLVRGDDGVVRGFLNACRHRGMQVASGCGTAKRFACPYHNWTYGNDGRLVAVPDRGAFAGCEADGLVELPVAERHGLLVLGPDPAGAVDVDEFLGAIGPAMTHFDLDRLELVARRETTVRCNWKLTNDMGMEGYHVRFLHGARLEGRAGFECIHDSFGRHQRLGFASPAAFDPDFLDRSPEELMKEINLTTFLHPSSFVVIGTDNVIYQRTAPGATPDETILLLATYSWGPLADDERDGAQKLFEFVWDLTIDEDIWAQEACQRSFQSGLLPQVTFGANEPALHHLHANWASAIS